MIHPRSQLAYSKKINLKYWNKQEKSQNVNCALIIVEFKLFNSES